MLLELSLALACAPATATQQYGVSATRIQRYGWGPVHQLGRDLDRIADRDGDGAADLLVSAPGASYSGMETGSAYVISSRTGMQLLRIDGPANRRGSSMQPAAAGDLDQDGFEDVLIGFDSIDTAGIDAAGAVFAYSGRGGAPLFEIRGTRYREGFGHLVDGDANLDGDGIPDFVVVGSANPATVSAFSGASSTLLYSFSIPEYAVDLLVADDLNGDGMSEILICWSGNYHLEVYSGADGAVLYTIVAAIDPSSLGMIGDLDGDGVRDIGLGLYWGRVALYSGAHGGLLRSHYEVNATYSSSTVADAGDANQDGVPDVALGFPDYEDGTYDGFGYVFIYSGADWSRISVQPGRVPDAHHGEALISMGDISGDGLVELATGSPRANERGWNFAGYVTITSYLPGLRSAQSSIHAAAGGPLDLLVDFGPQHADHLYQILISASGAGHFWLGTDIPLAFDDWVVRTLDRRFPAPIAPQAMFGVLSAEGGARASCLFPAGALNARIGSSLAMAAVIRPSLNEALPTVSSSAAVVAIQ